MILQTEAKITGHDLQIKSQTDDYLAKIKAAFDEVRQIIEDREAQIVAEYETKLSKEQKYLNSRRKETGK